jgi:hypothetical protein
MGLFNKLFSKQTSISEPQSEPEHAVIIHFKYGSTDLQPIFDLEDELEKAITAANAGEFDGNEVATDGSDGFLYMYGPNADALYEAILPVLQISGFMNGATAKLRYGPPEDGIKEIEKIITS